MSQYYAKLHVRVKTPDMWKKLYTINLSEYDIFCTGQELFDVSDNYVVIDDEWALDEFGLEALVEAISSRLKKNCIIIGECHNINVDTYTYLVYYLGSSVKAREFSSYYDDSDKEIEDDEDAIWGKGKMWGMMDNTNINSLTDCLNYYSIYGPGFEKEEVEYLKAFGIVAVNGELGTEFEEDIPNFGLPASIDLVGTQYEGRIPRIEKLVVGDTVKLVREPNNEYDPNAIDVQNNEGSLGHLEADACEILAPLLDKNKITYLASISSVTPLSKRSKRCKTALVSVHVEAIRK